MRGSAKGREPEEICVWKEIQRDGDGKLEYPNLPRPERDAMESSLCAEQTGQCVYCGRGISLHPHKDYHVEHFRPRSKYRCLQLDYENLFLSCGREGDQEIGQTADTTSETGSRRAAIFHPPPSLALSGFGSAHRAILSATILRKRQR